MNSFLPKGGGYRNLRVYRLTEIIHDLTMEFAKTYVRPGSRTRDQMEQAARSGKQNIVEGSEASTTSKETEIKPTNEAKASLEELLIDYKDYLRHNNLKIWESQNPRLLKLREYARSEQFMADPMRHIAKMNAEEFCNLCITLINQATYMLRKLIEKQQEQFLQNGGIREQMFRARTQYRSKRARLSAYLKTRQESQRGERCAQARTKDHCHRHRHRQRQKENQS